jgi:hypothetical protein
MVAYDAAESSAGAPSMTIDPKDARASLSDIAAVERLTQQSLTYEHSSRQFMLWGALVMCGYLWTYFLPGYSGLGWIAVAVMGVSGSFALRRWWQGPHSRDSRLGQRLGYAQLAVIGFGLILINLLWPLSDRQISAFWPILVMFCHVLAGIWLGRFYVLLGLAVTALIFVGYIWSGPWYPLWLAAAVGGGLIASGLWLRRMG